MMVFSIFPSAYLALGGLIKSKNQSNRVVLQQPSVGQQVFKIKLYLIQSIKYCIYSRMK